VTKLKKFRFLSVLILLAGIVVLPLVLWNARSLVALSNQFTQQFSAPPQITSPLVVPVYTAQQTADQTFPSATASAIYIMDRQSGSILYERHSLEARYPASVAKMMTALVARKIYPLDKVLQIKEEAFATGSSAHFILGEEVTVQNLLYALLLPSGNDAAFVLATHHPFGYEGFVNEMNQLAKQLHLSQTHFQNPSGLDDEKQVATARDLAILANEVMKDETLRQVVGTKQTTITDTSNKMKHHLVSTHELLGVVNGVVGIKTGTTESAGENLVTEVDRDGHQIIIVLLGSQNRYNETTAIIKWLFSHYVWETSSLENK
jgi:D-alanyl-D-alanine carboxypeptidase (penicillin-binding protein 5/6)